jgi:hypothetical protein
MIRPLRQRHRPIVSLLAALLPVTLAVAVAARKPFPAGASFLSNSTGPGARFPAFARERDDLFTATGTRVRLLRESPGAGRFAVELLGAKDFAKPDLLVYWVEGIPSGIARLPENARLLGAFNPPAALPLPPDAGRGGYLVLYSLADQMIVEVSKPFAPGKL